MPFLPFPTEDLEDDDDDEDELDRELYPEDVKEEVSPVSMHGSILETASQPSCLLCPDAGRGGGGCQPHSSMVAPQNSGPWFPETQRSAADPDR